MSRWTKVTISPAIMVAFLTLSLLTPVASARTRRIVGYHKPLQLVCRVIHSNVESPYLSDTTKSGAELSVRYCASDDLPFETKVYIAYKGQSRHRAVKKTLFRVVADRPKHADPKYVKVEPYIHGRDEEAFLATFEGVRKVTVIKPIYGN